MRYYTRKSWGYGLGISAHWDDCIEITINVGKWVFVLSTCDELPF